MSAQIRAVLAEERAREPAIAPCPAMPVLTDAMCEGMDSTWAHIDSELADEGDPWWLLLAGALVIVAVIVWSVYAPMGVIS